MRTLCLLSLLSVLLLSMPALAQKKEKDKDKKDKKKDDKKPEPKLDLDKLMAKATFTKDKHTLPYRLFVPAVYKADTINTYPLVVFLHGAGERGDDNNAQLKHGVADFVKEASQQKDPCFVLAPQCPKEEVWVYGQLKGLTKKKKKPEVEAGDLVLALVDSLCEEYRIDKKRIYLTGLSMGGYGTWELLARKPDLFAAAVPVCGGGDVTKAQKIARIPIWCFHGDKDEAVPVERSREMIAALEKAGGKPKYKEYKGVGHDSWTQTYSDPEVHAWLFAQKKE